MSTKTGKDQLPTVKCVHQFRNLDGVLVGTPKVTYGILPVVLLLCKLLPFTIERGLGEKTEWPFSGVDLSLSFGVAEAK